MAMLKKLVTETNHSFSNYIINVSGLYFSVEDSKAVYLSLL